MYFEDVIPFIIALGDNPQVVSLLRFLLTKVFHLLHFHPFVARMSTKRGARCRTRSTRRPQAPHWATRGSQRKKKKTTTRRKNQAATRSKRQSPRAEPVRRRRHQDRAPRSGLTRTRSTRRSRHAKIAPRRRSVRVRQRPASPSEPKR